ncbi:hypothetical protein L596_029067 [Steinernema carpocapsae]|uniref:Uncharacterized protein n=1 Tax=Steinernema carpocapsae TaxID=34508 RepID=A0A4U5LTJ0_STECR|nr:hypothetical protein L596_029067 [Steinernema carpocapsae]
MIALFVKACFSSCLDGLETSQLWTATENVLFSAQLTDKSRSKPIVTVFLHMGHSSSIAEPHQKRPSWLHTGCRLRLKMQSAFTAGLIHRRPENEEMKHSAKIDETRNKNRSTLPRISRIPGVALLY